MRRGCEMDILNGRNGTTKTSYFGTSTGFRTDEGFLPRVCPPREQHINLAFVTLVYLGGLFSECKERKLEEAQNHQPG